jgi:hypothetical protein
MMRLIDSALAIGKSLIGDVAFGSCLCDSVIGYRKAEGKRVRLVCDVDG